MKEAEKKAIPDNDIHQPICDYQKGTVYVGFDTFIFYIVPKNKTRERAQVCFEYDIFSMILL